MNMEAFFTDQLILEGSDLSGKTSLYNALHKNTNFKWNIQDRSALSMLCYARLYDRPTHQERIRLQNELSNLNNRMILLLPPFSVIEERYHARGDEIQDINSLRKLYDIFAEEAEKIRSRPTVMCIFGDNDLDSVVMYVLEWSHSIESCTPWNVGEIVRDTLHAVESDELTLTAKISYPADIPNGSILKNKGESEYYKDVLNQVSVTIQNEMDGKNPYNIPQSLTSRRFFYNSSTCISGIHFLPREGLLKVLVTFRSTDVDKNASIDLQFIEYLSHKINRRFKFDCTNIKLFITFNSAHIRRDLEVQSK
jgi:hypothetical protein